MLLRLLASVASLAGAYAVYELLKLVYRELNSPLKHLPGPQSAHWFYGNMREIFKADNSVMHEKWVREFGPTLRYRAFFMQRLYTVDTGALNHFLVNSNIYQKPEEVRYTLGRMLGRGILVAEGEQHKQQRKVMNPAFGAPQIRELTEIFLEKSVELRDIWANQVSDAGGSARVDILSWLSKATLDVIGLAGFNYHFNNLSSEKSELGEALATLFRTGMSLNLLRILQNFVPALRLIPTTVDNTMNASQATMKRIGRQLIQDSKNEMAESGTFEKGVGRSRDLLSLLVRANTSQDIPASQRLSDEDVLAQVPTFLVAGHETTSAATTWALYALTQDLKAQTRLREELLAVPTESPTMDQLNDLPYLDCVVRETLRIHAPVPSTMRIATQDDIVPLATPFTDRHGKVHQTLRVVKGQTIMIPILAMNRDPAIWGEDAMEFNPERWESSSTSSNSLPGVWGHMLTFLGGPRACIGYRFSLVEMKALLFTLVRAFEFELAVPADDIRKKDECSPEAAFEERPRRRQSDAAHCKEAYPFLVSL
ncbi:cytochrome P450 [Roridomyces roridus]|uniref:Cytochrome P450 n=1 Tax=Roridomyces roridus TaxID=1738132 RepID=A0AAD7B5X4_9AGAR|nr:cytochrome P450 [Roridomyces roridus]